MQTVALKLKLAISTILRRKIMAISTLNQYLTWPATLFKKNVQKYSKPPNLNCPKCNFWRSRDESLKIFFWRYHGEARGDRGTFRHLVGGLGHSGLVSPLFLFLGTFLLHQLVRITMDLTHIRRRSRTTLSKNGFPFYFGISHLFGINPVCLSVLKLDPAEYVTTDPFNSKKKSEKLAVAVHVL